MELLRLLNVLAQNHLIDILVTKSIALGNNEIGNDGAIYFSECMKKNLLINEVGMPIEYICMAI